VSKIKSILVEFLSVCLMMSVKSAMNFSFSIFVMASPEDISAAS